MAEVENRETPLRGARSGGHDENGALAELARFADAERRRREQRKRPAATLRREQSNLAPLGPDTRERNVGDNAALTDAEMARDQQAADISFADAAPRRLLYFTALAVVIGGCGLMASLSWPKLSSPTETALLARQQKEANPRVKNMSDISPRDIGAAPEPGAESMLTRGAEPSASPTPQSAGSMHNDLGYVLQPIEEAALRPKLLFDQAPPLALDSSSEQLEAGKAEKAGDVANAGDGGTVGGIEKEAKPGVGNRETVSNCLVKIDGRILINRSCGVSWMKQREATFELGGKSLTIAHDHRRTWLATLGGRELGKVYKTGSCWGSKRVYICEYKK